MDLSPSDGVTRHAENVVVLGVPYVIEENTLPCTPAFPPTSAAALTSGVAAVCPLAHVSEYGRAQRPVSSVYRFVNIFYYPVFRTLPCNILTHGFSSGGK